mmetsp:Transcript_9927/g.11885  ORF Transcript_9927/g.11885 Transcript_9927/m.11885 type:complete len:142 (+) Transcript_9927:76-501(+)
MKFVAEEVNAAFAAICPELTSKYAIYPIDFEKWLELDDVIDGEKVFQKSDNDMGLKENYVWCKNGPRGRGYYHLLTKMSYVNLYSRLSSSAPSSCCANQEMRKKVDQWDTTRRVVYNRTRPTRPNDELGAESAIDHLGTPP